MSSWIIVTTAVIGAVVILPFIMGLFGGNKFQVEGKTVLITGASQGYGLAAARQVAAKGANVILVARNVSKLEKALEEVKAAASNPSVQRFHYISQDLTTSEGNIATVSEATRLNNGRAPDIVWCIAGDSFPQFWLETKIDTLRWQMDINYWAAAYMAHAILNSWLAVDSTSKGTERHLIFTSSSTAFYSPIGYQTYSPAKAALRNLHEGLRNEILIYSENVKLHTVFPGGILSPGFENENICKPEITKQLEASDPVQTPDEVASKAIKGLEKGEELIVTNFIAQTMRAHMWASFPKNNWFWDTFMILVVIVAWPFARWDLDGQVRKYGQKHGHPSGYVKRRKD